MMLENFHFIRPYMLTLFLVPFFVFIIYKKTKSNLSEWRKACDKNLLEHLVSKQGAKTPKLLFFLVLLFWFLSIVAIAGPAYKKLPVPTFENKNPACIILDMSFEMAVNDVSPRRLDRAKYKITDMLKNLKTHQVCLIAYAKEPFVLTSFTNDLEIIKNLMPSISFDIMPVQGVRPDKAIDKAIETFEKTNNAKGRIYLLSASGGKYFSKTIRVAKKAKEKGHKIYVIGVGTKKGAPIVDAKGNFISDENGKAIISKLRENELKEIAKFGGGQYLHINSSDNQLDNFMKSNNNLEDKKQKIEKQLAKADVYQDAGVYLLPLILVIFAFFFRKGVIACLVLFFITFQPANAHAFSWEDLWLNKNQQAKQAFDNKEYKKALDLFEDKDWKAVSKYRLKKYDEAIKDLTSKEQSKIKEEYIRNNYNLGNAFAFSKDFDKALEAYDKVLKINPEHKDAKHNYEIVKKLKKQQEQKNNKKNKENNKKKKNQSKKKEQNKQQKQQNKNQKSTDKNQNQKSSKQKSGENKQQKKQNKKQNSKVSNANKNKQSQSKQSEKNKKSSKTDEKQKNTMNKKGKDEKGEKQRVKPVEQRFYDKKNNWDGKKQKQEQLYGKIPDDPSGLLRSLLYKRYQKRLNK